MNHVDALIEKKVTWVELFFDLVFVYAVARVSELLQEDHSPLGMVQALVVFIPIYWVWGGTTVHANLHDPDTTRDRLGIVSVGACGLLLAITLPHAWHDHGVWFGGAYWAARLVMLLLVTGRENRSAFTTFTVGSTVTGPLLVAGGLLHDEILRLIAWSVAALIDLSVPRVAASRLARVPFQPGHLTERFGTFIIIALGETVVATAAGAEHLDWLHMAALLAMFTVVCGLWWVYFSFGPDAIRSALEETEARIDLIRPVLSYGHLALIAGIVAIAAGIGRAVADPAEPLTTDVAILLFGGTALYLVTFAFTRWRLFHTIAVPRLSATVVVLALFLLATRVWALVSVVLLAVTLIVLNVVESRVLPRTLRRHSDTT